MNRRILLPAIAALPIVAMAAAPSLTSRPAGSVKLNAEPVFSVSKNASAVASEKNGTTGASARKAAPSRKKAQVFLNDATADVEKYGTLQLLASEDFSLLNFGSENEPSDRALEISPWLLDGAGNIRYDQQGNPMENPEFEYPWNNMIREYTHEPGWGIGNAKAAGGCLSMTLDRDNPEAHVVTPIRDFTINPGGIAVCEFKAKAAPGTTFSFIRVESAETYNWSPTWDYPEEAVDIYDIPDTWTTVRVLIQGAGASTLFNIVQLGGNGQVFIDDVKVYSVAPKVEIPVTRRHSNFTDGSFTARWNAVPGAGKYLVNCYYVDEYTGHSDFVARDLEVTGTEYTFTGINDFPHYYTVRAVIGDDVSIESLPRLVFDVVAPEFFDANITDPDFFVASWDEVVNAYGFNYMAMAKRTAEADGEFMITDTDFSDLMMSDDNIAELEKMGYIWPLDESNPCPYTFGMFYPEELRQNGWRGENYLPYDGFVKLDGWWTNNGQQSGWISPEFDLSKDNGNIRIRMRCYAQPSLWETVDGGYMTVYSQPCVALFNWDDEIGDYSQVEIQYLPAHPNAVKDEWTDCEFNLTKGGKRSVIGIFAVYGMDDLYVDDLKISQNYKKGESFMDPFCFRYYQIKGSEEVTEEKYMEEVAVPDFVPSSPIYEKAQAVRVLLSAPDPYSGQSSILLEQESPWSEDHFVMDYQSGIECVRDIVSEGDVTYYDLQGRKVSGNAEKGLYLKRQGNRTEKILVK